MWGDKISFILGCSLSSCEVPVSVKLGAGYQLSDYNDFPFAMEVKFLFKVFSF